MLKDFMCFAIMNSLGLFWTHAFTYFIHFCTYHTHQLLNTNLALFVDGGYLIYSKLINVLKIATVTYMSVTQVGSTICNFHIKKNKWLPDSL